MFSIGQNALVSMISHLLFIFITWRVLQTINISPLIRKGRGTEARILMLLIAISVGTGVSRFFLDIFKWTQDLMYLF